MLECSLRITVIGGLVALFVLFIDLFVPFIISKRELTTSTEITSQ